MKKWIAFLLTVIAAASLIGCTVSMKETQQTQSVQSGKTDFGTSAETGNDIGTFGLYFITIGKGDAFLLETPQKTYYLVDTGKIEDYRQIARLLRVCGVTEIKGIFLSHGHKDHAGGLDAVMTAFPVKEVFVSGKDTVSYTQIDPEEICRRHGVTLTKLQGGETLSLDGITAEIMVPDSADMENENNNSIVMRIEHGDNSFLMTGDAELLEEAMLCQKGEALKSDVLKLGHHGETDATSEQFLDLVSPKIALITGNEEENPDSVNEIIRQRLEKRKIETYYSESEGLGIAFFSDGKTITSQTVYDKDLPCSLTLAISKADRIHQRITIRNDGAQTAHLGGCVLVSERGNEHFVFPEGTVLDAGEELTVSDEENAQAGDLIWDDVWHKKHDAARLYDSNINLLAQDPQ